MSTDPKIKDLLNNLKKEFGTYNEDAYSTIISAENKSHSLPHLSITRITEKANQGEQYTYAVASFSDDYYNCIEECNDVIYSLKDILLDMFKDYNIANNDLVFVAGLGNSCRLSYSLGSKVCKRIIPTSNFVTGKIEGESSFNRPVCAMAPNAADITGIPSSVIIKSAIDELKPKLIIAVNSLGTHDDERLARSYQISNYGIRSRAPYDRLELTQKEIGIPVIAIGAPVMLYDNRKSFTSLDVDLCMERLAIIIGDGVSMALHSEWTLEDLRNWQADTR